jgi:uncharacterized protein YqhQ
VAKFYYGGQAVIEGVMMRGRHSAAVAVRQPSGAILLHEERLSPRVYASRLFQLPFLRGVLLLWEMLALGSRMLAFSAAAALPPEAGGKGTPSDTPTVVLPSGSRVVETRPGVEASTGSPALGLTLALSLAFAVAVFFLTPVALVGAAQRWVGLGWLSLLAEGVVRLALLLTYLWLIGRMPGVQRVFQYHGAEHKAINTLEAGQPLDMAHVRRASRVHTRCGTGFLLLVMAVSIFVFALAGRPPLPLLLLSRVVLVPVVAAIAYELMRLGAAHYHNRGVRWLLAPGLALQGLTTREPDESQIECAIAALDRVLRDDGVGVLQPVV